MLKNCYLSSQNDILSSKTCGEIICQSETLFTIICKFCNIKIFEFNEFVQHFRNAHWTETNLLDDGFNQNKKFQVEKGNGNESIKTEDYEEERGFSDEYNLIEAIDDYEHQDEWTPYKDYGQRANNDENNSSDMESLAILKKKLETNNKRKQTFKCSFCKHSFTNKSLYTTHLQKHKNYPFKCNKCSKTFAEENLLTQHLKTHSYPCKLCTRVYQSYDSLRYHKETHIETKNFVCDFNNCNKTFVNKTRLNVHKRIHSRESFVCEVCGSQQRHKQALKDHIRKHTGEKPFACALCDRCFATSSLLIEHQACHETERKHVCDVCGKSFNRKKALYHHKPLHLDIKKFLCKVCGARYAQAAGLSAHLRKHKENKITNIEPNSKTNDLFDVFFS